MNEAEQIVVKLLETDDVDPKDFIDRHDIQVNPRVRISFSRTRFHDDGSGNYDEENGWIDEEGQEFELDEHDLEDGKTLAIIIAEFLRRNGATQPSSSHFHEGIWYADYGNQDNDGWNEERHYHLVDVDEETQAQVFRYVMSGIPGR